MSIKKSISILATVLFISTSLTAQTVYQWRYNRTGVYPETELQTSWPETGPQLLWTSEKLPKGFSSATVTPHGVFLTGVIDSSDVLVALSKTGEIKWKTPYGAYWKISFQDSRCTPTVEGDKVYVSSGNGDVACVSATDGKIVWQVKASKKFNGTYGEWGLAESILIDGEKLFFTPCGPTTTMIALNKNTGDLVWKSESINDAPAYVSPILIEKAGKRMVINITASYVIAVDVANGNIIWKVKHLDIDPEECLKVWPDAPKIKCVTPLYSEGNIYITGGYNHVGALLKLSDDGSKAEVAWTDSVMDVHHGGVVLVNGYIYGSNWLNNGDGNWCCIDWKTGKKMYDQKWNCKGSIIAADGMLYLYDEKKGNIGLVKPNPEKFELISSFKIPRGTGPHWAHPVIADGVLYVRHGDALMAFDIRKK